MDSKGHLTVAEAKQKLAESLDAVDPMNVVRKKPLAVVGIVAAAGMLLGFTKAGLVKRAVSYSSLPMMLIKKLF